MLVPVVCFVVSVFLVVAPIVDDPSIELLFAAAFIAAGLFFYVPFVHFGVKLGWLWDDVAAFFQLLLLVAPPKGEEEFR